MKRFIISVWNMKCVLRIRRPLRISAGVIPWIVLIVVGYPVAMPADHWMTVEAIRVSDVAEGETPKMVVIHTIKREFVADWVVTVRRIESSGGLIAACPAAKGRNDYRTNSVLPPPQKLNLLWWMNGEPCHLEPGAYVVTTKWKVDLPTPWDKEISIVSNVFTVK